jgi:SAM-dependent methyltransferase
VHADTYDREYFPLLERLEPTSFWFRSRNRLIEWTLRNYFPDARTFLEVGCGTGYVLAHLAQALPGLRLVGGELFPEGLAVARRRVPDAELVQLDVHQMPYEAVFDVVGAFDVLEHIPDDAAALREIRKAVRPNGGLVLTVPQHPRLWSPADEFAHHQRRYARPELVALVESAGWALVRVTSFMMTPLPLMMISRRWARWKERRGTPYRFEDEFALPRFLDAGLEQAVALERMAISRGATLPWGGSLLLVARAR